MELTVLDVKGGKTTRTVSLLDTVFGVEPNDHAIYLDVKQYLANQRQGTHKAKQRNEVAGSTRKLKRQKGTGGARAGSILSPLFPGGGRIFGPVPRDYGFKLNKKLKQLARRGALSYKMRANAVAVVEDMSFDVPRTKGFIEVLGALGLSGKKVLLVLPEANHNVSLSARNLPGVKVVIAANVNTYDVMNAGVLLFCEGAVGVVNEMLA